MNVSHKNKIFSIIQFTIFISKTLYEISSLQKNNLIIYSNNFDQQHHQTVKEHHIFSITSTEKGKTINMKKKKSRNQNCGKRTEN